MPLDLPPWVQSGFVDPLPALQFGLVTGATGATVGAVYGLFKTAHLGAFASAAGVTSFLYGSNLRGAILAAQEQERTKKGELTATGIAGALTGVLSGATHRRVYSALRSGILVGALGIAAQAGYHAFVARAKEPRAKTSLVDRIAKRLPLRSMSDSEYEGILNEKIVRIDAEIAMLDERIANLRRQNEFSKTSES